MSDVLQLGGIMVRRGALKAGGAHRPLSCEDDEVDYLLPRQRPFGVTMLIVSFGEDVRLRWFARCAMGAKFVTEES
jgi:hypothetical protein